MSVDGFLKRQVQLGTVSQIPVRADKRWIFVLLPLVQNPAGSIRLGIAATALFFVSIFLHEYAHAAVARAEGLHVVEIVLHPFGGLTRFAMSTGWCTSSRLDKCTAIEPSVVEDE